jgi:probable HAF family extracellular repeat protein
MHGFVDSGGSLTVIDDPSAGPLGTFALGINNGGQIVGFYYETSGLTQAFLATPVPEPRTLAV